LVQRRGGVGARSRSRAALHRARGLATRGGGRPRPRAAQDPPGFLPGGGRGLELAGERRPPRRGTERRGVPLPHDLSAAARHRRAGAGPRHDAPVHPAVEPGVAGAARLLALLAARARHPGVDCRGGGALRPRPAVRLRGLPQPAETGDEARGRPDGELRLWTAPQESVGEEPGGALTLQHVSARRAPARPHRPAGSRRPRRGALSRRRAVPVLRGPARRQAHLLGHLRRAPGRHPAPQAIAARSARAAAPGSVATPPHTAPMTATPAAPARTTAAALATVTPPIPITGVPAGASCASRRNPSAPSGAPASDLFAVAKQGPTLQ